MSRTIYLDKQGQVDLMRYLQRLQRARGKVVVIRHRTLADRLGVSESTARRRVNEMVDAGHIVRAYIPRPSRGGMLCVYKVDTDVIYRRGSFFRQARQRVEQVIKDTKRNGGGGSGPSGSGGSGPKNQNNKKNKRTRHRSINKKDLNALLEVARLAGIDDKQRGYLRGAALRYGIKEAWTALKMAFDDGYSTPDLVRVTWGILKNQYPEGVIT